MIPDASSCILGNLLLPLAAEPPNHFLRLPVFKSAGFAAPAVCSSLQLLRHLAKVPPCTWYGITPFCRAQSALSLIGAMKFLAKYSACRSVISLAPGFPVLFLIAAIKESVLVPKYDLFRRWMTAHDMRITHVSRGYTHQLHNLSLPRLLYLFGSAIHSLPDSTDQLWSVRH